MVTLTQRLALASPDLLDPAVVVPALVADVVGSLSAGPVDRPTLARLDDLFGRDAPRSTRAGAGLVCWLLTDPEVVDHPGVEASNLARGGRVTWFMRVLVKVTTELSPVRDAHTWVHDEVGREEAARAVLMAGDLLPAGESAQAAADRWQAVSTVYQRGTAQAVAQEVRHAEELARALAEKQAKEAAAQYANY